jgi:hypothetical protein
MVQRTISVLFCQHATDLRTNSPLAPVEFALTAIKPIARQLGTLIALVNTKTGSGHAQNPVQRRAGF